MSGVEVVGTILAVVQLIGAVVNVFGTTRNAPRQVDRLRRILKELEDDSNLLQSTSVSDRNALADMINRSRDLLEEYAPPTTGTRMRDFLWPAQAEETLRTFNDDISSELSRLYTRSLRHHNGQQMTESSALLSDPKLTSPPQHPEVATRTPTGTVNSLLIAQTALESARRTSVRIDLSATITLERGDGTPFGQPLVFKRLNIMERDEAMRTIEYECPDPPEASARRITHRIPRGTIRFEDNDLNDSTVSFLDPHDITIEDSQGYSIHRIHAEYKFESVDAREMFLLKVRERELLGRFFVRAVLRDNGTTVTQQKVIRIWRKVLESTGRSGHPRRNSASRERVTVSFLGRDKQQFELPLGDYRRNPRQDGPGNNRITLTKLVDGSSFIFDFYPPAQRRSSGIERFLGFSSPNRVLQADADAFKAKFMEYHPATSAFVPLPSPATSIGSSTCPAQAPHEISLSSQPREPESAWDEDVYANFSHVSWEARNPGVRGVLNIASTTLGSTSNPGTEPSTSPATSISDWANESDLHFGLMENQAPNDTGT